MLSKIAAFLDQNTNLVMFIGLALFSLGIGIATGLAGFLISMGVGLFMISWVKLMVSV